MKKKSICIKNISWKAIMLIIIVCYAIPVEASEQLHWYIQQGKGRPLCERLTRIVNTNPTLGVTPNIPWKQVLSIKEVNEPRWTELAPLQYESLFLKAHKFIQSKNTLDEQVIPFVRWFLPIEKRWVEESIRKKPLTDEEALNIYRDFARRGGKLKVFRCDISDDKAHKMIRAFVQYESSEKNFSDWDGYTLQAEPDLAEIHEAGYPITGLGRGYRLLIYKNDLFSFVGFRRGSHEYLVSQMSGDRSVENSPHYLETFYCKINAEVIKRGKKK